MSLLSDIFGPSETTREILAGLREPGWIWKVTPEDLEEIRPYLRPRGTWREWADDPGPVERENAGRD